MHTQPITTASNSNFVVALAEILGVAAHEPATLDEANELLYSIEDAASKALFNR